MAPGTNCGKISATAALELGLSDSTFVATSIIDAHAGGLALVAAGAKTKQDLIGRLGLICGTSACHICFECRSHLCARCVGTILQCYDSWLLAC
nr:FGGY carbohydrate kinase domain-containing protein-like [Cherax quadricarinatus]